jgi:hypothetical protein
LPTADTPQQSAQDAASDTVLGSSDLESLRDYADENDNVEYEEQVQQDGSKKYYLLTTDEAGNTTSQEFAVDADNNQVIYVGGEKDGERFRRRWDCRERADQMQDTEDQLFQDQQGLADEIGGLTR